MQIIWFADYSHIIIIIIIIITNDKGGKYHYLVPCAQTKFSIPTKIRDYLHEL
jgi:hypothetical protein